jgi:hypothetical protein
MGVTLFIPTSKTYYSGPGQKGPALPEEALHEFEVD